MDIYEKQIFHRSLQTKVDKVSDNADSFNEFRKETRSINKEFFFQITILCTAILGLSATFVGVFASTDMNYIWILFVAWTFLTVGLLGSLFRSFVYNSYGHWQMNRISAEGLLEVEEAALELAERYPDDIANINTDNELEEYRETKRKNIEIYQRGIKRNQAREGMSLKKWKVSELSAIYGVAIGVILLLIYISINVVVLNKGQTRDLPNGGMQSSIGPISIDAKEGISFDRIQNVEGDLLDTTDWREHTITYINKGEFAPGTYDLVFKHPPDWEVTEEIDNSGCGAYTVSNGQEQLIIWVLCEEKMKTTLPMPADAVIVESEPTVVEPEYYVNIVRFMSDMNANYRYMSSDSTETVTDQISVYTPIDIEIYAKTFSGTHSDTVTILDTIVNSISH